MFILTKIADLVEIAPEDFRKKSVAAIEDNINAKYANKVIQKIGLCICLYDLLWTSEGLIGHGTGLVNVNGVPPPFTTTRQDELPFKGEVMFGRIRSSTPAGINLRTDFFDDIFIPFDELPEGAELYLWIWNIEGDRLFYDNHEMVRFQVIDEEWHDQTPAGPSQGRKLHRLSRPTK
ncbi:RNA polymerase III subunit Rpc25 [Colletotrichum higginsianum]|nr:RNA polymerase III subunit Rpc25 [Colletotrichum higginsianum]